MNNDFNWDCHVSTEEKNKIKSDIEHFIENNKSFLCQCHQGAVKIQLNIVGPLLDELLGNIKCSCGKPLVTLKGSSDGVNMRYEKIE